MFNLKPNSEITQFIKTLSVYSNTEYQKHNDFVPHNNSQIIFLLKNTKITTPTEVEKGHFWKKK